MDFKKITFWLPFALGIASSLLAQIIYVWLFNEKDLQKLSKLVDRLSESNKQLTEKELKKLQLACKIPNLTQTRGINTL